MQTFLNQPEKLLTHPFPPVYNSKSRILILGSFPSKTSRERRFYYGHPRNRFWPLLALLLEAPIPQSITEKTALLHNRGIALYDAVAACTVNKSEDAGMKSIIPAGLERIFQEADIRAVFANGSKAYEVCVKQIGIQAVKLPSTSPANARFHLEDLQQVWRQILVFL